MIGNVFILSIFLKKSRRLTSNAFCFNALAISDILALIFMLMSSMLNLKIVAHRAVTCKLIKYLYNISLQTSSWCLVLLTIDRLIAVCYVFKYQTWCKRWYAMKLLFGIVAFILIVNMHLLIFVDAGVYNVLTETNGLTTTASSVISTSVHSCYVDTEKYTFYFKYIYSYWDLYHAIIYGILPFLIILICNVMIVVRLSKLTKV